MNEIFFAIKPLQDSNTPHVFLLLKNILLYKKNLQETADRT